MRLFLYLISIIYNIITTLRNILFDYHILKSKKHKIPIICIGNLSLGGSGKTPQTNYIAKLLSKDYNIAILSRGYGRNSSGFHYVELDSSPEFVGDEPLQLKYNNPNCLIAVDKNRNKAVKKITKDYPDTNVILLDDGFQHRWINPGLNILITTFKKPYTKDYLIPLGRLREHKKGADRSNIILISKTPHNINNNKKNKLVKSLKIKESQKVYFSSIIYHKYKSIQDHIEIENEKEYSITLVTGIAKPNNLVDYLEEHAKKVNLIKFSDHHKYSSKDIKNILLEYDKDKSTKKLILTTEKDATKLRRLLTQNNIIHFYYIPIDVSIDKNNIFNKQILDYVRKN